VANSTDARMGGSGQNSEQTKARILSAAEELFGANGFQKTRLEDVAAAAQVSRPLVYRYFSNKETLFGLVVERILREWNEVLIAEAARKTPSTAHTLRRVLTACLDFAQSRTVLRGLLSRDSKLVLSHFDIIQRTNDMLRHLVRDVLESGGARGDVRTDLDFEDLAHVVSEVFIAYSDHIVAGETTSLSERRVEAIIETLLHGITMPVGPR